MEAMELGLKTANSLNISTLTIAAPVENISIQNLSENVIKTVTAEAIISYLKRTTQFAIQKIICTDFSSTDNEKKNINENGNDLNINGGAVHSPSDTIPFLNQQGNIRVSDDTTQNHEICLQPACGNRMVYALLILLEQETVLVKNAEKQREIELRNRSKDPFSILNNNQRDGNNNNSAYDKDVSRQPSIKLIICNAPIPCAMSALSIYPILHQQQQHHQLQLQQRRNQSNMGYNGFDHTYLRSTGNGAYPPQPYGEYRYEEQGTIVIRGLSSGILRAVRAIKNLVATASSSY